MTWRANQKTIGSDAAMITRPKMPGSVKTFETDAKRFDTVEVGTLNAPAGIACA